MSARPNRSGITISTRQPPGTWRPAARSAGLSTGATRPRPLPACAAPQPPVEATSGGWRGGAARAVVHRDGDGAEIAVRVGAAIAPGRGQILSQFECQEWVESGHRDYETLRFTRSLK